MQSGIAAATAARAGAKRGPMSRLRRLPQRGQGSPARREATAISQTAPEGGRGAGGGGGGRGGGRCRGGGGGRSADRDRRRGGSRPQSRRRRTTAGGGRGDLRGREGWRSRPCDGRGRGRR